MCLVSRQLGAARHRVRVAAGGDRGARGDFARFVGFGCVAFFVFGGGGAVAVERGRCGAGLVSVAARLGVVVTAWTVARRRRSPAANIWVPGSGGSVFLGSGVSGSRVSGSGVPRRRSAVSRAGFWAPGFRLSRVRRFRPVSLGRARCGEPSERGRGRREPRRERTGSAGRRNPVFLRAFRGGRVPERPRAARGSTHTSTHTCVAEASGVRRTRIVRGGAAVARAPARIGPWSSTTALRAQRALGSRTSVRVRFVGRRGGRGITRPCRLRCDRLFLPARSTSCDLVAHH